MTTKAEAKRIEFLNTLFTGINSTELPLEFWQNIVHTMYKEGPALGRTDRWQNACKWAARTLDEMNGWNEIATVKWAAFQGSIFMGRVA